MGTNRFLRTVAVLFIIPLFYLINPPLASGDEGGKNAASEHSSTTPRLIIPSMDSMKGKELFINKGCIACHAVNGVGGEDAPPFDADSMEEDMNVYEFAARMWNHSQGMAAAQMEELGEQILLTGQDLAHITFFVHDKTSQNTVSEADLPDRIREMIGHGHDDDEDDHDKDEKKKHSD